MVSQPNCACVRRQFASCRQQPQQQYSVHCVWCGILLINIPICIERNKDANAHFGVMAMSSFLHSFVSHSSADNPDISVVDLLFPCLSGFSGFHILDAVSCREAYENVVELADRSYISRIRILNFLACPSHRHRRCKFSFVGTKRILITARCSFSISINWMYIRSSLYHQWFDVETVDLGWSGEK